MKYSDEEIKKLNEVLNIFKEHYINKSFGDLPDANYISEKLNINCDYAQYLKNEVCKYGEKNEFMVIDKAAGGNCFIINIDKFKIMEIKNEVEKEKNPININGNNNVIGQINQDSILSNIHIENAIPNENPAIKKQKQAAIIPILKFISENPLISSIIAGLIVIIIGTILLKYLKII